MRVLEICLSSGYGGLELYMARVSDYLCSNKISTRILVRRGSFLDKRLEEKKLDRGFLSVWFYSLPLIAALKLARYIRRNQIELVHVHHGKDLFLCVLACVFAGGVRLVYTRQMALTRPKRDFYHRFIYQHIDAYLVITRSLYNDAVRYLPLPAERIHLLYYGVASPDSQGSDCQAFLQESGINPDSVKVAIFGRIEAGKGQHLVAKAVTTLRGEGYPVQAAILGHVMDQDYFANLQGMLKNSNMPDAVRYLGFHSKPLSIMPCFDVVVLATRCETFGLVLVEAMRAGVCVVGTNCGGVPEIIQHGKTGLLFNSDDAEDLTNKLRTLLQNPEQRATMARAGQQDADNRFSEEKHFKNLLGYFDQVMMQEP